MKNLDGPNLKKVPLSSIFYALSDPARLEIVRYLLLKEESPCGHCKTPLSKSTMSHHFKVLRQAGLIQKRTEGKVHFISLCEKELEGRLPGFLKLLERTNGPL
jgi:DNA-binding transcriptional ArsR family regulator